MLNNLEGWELSTRSNVLDVKYEDLVADELGTFAKVVAHLGIELSERRLKRIVRKSSFKILSEGRKRGSEDQSSHLRKGVSGDWKNHMPEGSPLHRAFMEQYGDLIAQLNYM